jgi:glycosyltransferase involved in cell wall biosynthesis
LVVRQERTIEKLSDSNISKLSSIFSLLTIGLIRKDKKLEFSINAVKSLPDESLIFTIAGRSIEHKYEEEISKLIPSYNTTISRRNYFLSTDEFTHLIEESHFLVLCDKKQLSTVTNGTMMEALLLNRPIIAPNYLPYSYYINTYNIGILFDPEDISSLSNAIKEAKKVGMEYFTPYIKEFQKTILFEKAAEQFCNDLEIALKT